MKNLFTRFLAVVGVSLTLSTNAFLTKNTVLPVTAPTLVAAAPSLPQARQSWASKLVVQGRKVAQFMHQMTPRQRLLVAGGLTFAAATGIAAYKMFSKKETTKVLEHPAPAIRVIKAFKSIKTNEHWTALEQQYNPSDEKHHAYAVEIQIELEGGRVYDLSKDNLLHTSIPLQPTPSTEPTNLRFGSILGQWFEINDSTRITEIKRFNPAPDSSANVINTSLSHIDFKGLQTLKHELEQMGTNVELQLAPASLDFNAKELAITVIPKLSQAQNLSQRAEAQTSKLWSVPLPENGSLRQRDSSTVHTALVDLQNKLREVDPALWKDSKSWVSVRKITLTVTGSQLNKEVVATFTA